jgi:YidC/Oxa1 family membrane protein insertase
VLIVQVCLHPLTKYSQVSMMKMQKTMAKLKPEMERVRKKYANDPAKRNQELMKLQREKGMGVGQMMGCLPMFLNMPIWVALFSGLNTEVSLRHASFLPFWLTDLAAPDALITWAPIHMFGFSISSFNLLPLLVAGLMFLQMKSNPSMTGQGAAMSPEQESSQKMMRRMMPAMMLLFFYNMPSGLNLYIMSSNVFRLIEQKRIRQHIAEQDEAKAAQETVVQITGKGGRQNRGKKGKGPFWTKRS